MTQLSADLDRGLLIDGPFVGFELSLVSVRRREERDGRQGLGRGRVGRRCNAQHCVLDSTLHIILPETIALLLDFF